MERLTKCVGIVNGKPVYTTNIDMRKKGAVDKLINALGKYEDLETQGKLLKLPCIPGQDVFVLVDMNDNGVYTRVKHDVVKSVYIDEKNTDIPMLEFTYVWHDTELSDVGQTVFLTKEAAEAKLEELKKRSR